uniref:Uncharacterized protein n=1 Tax=Romanomermis culicivorax TaxID=13658 RepID=A0A915J9X7_ROMCU
LEAHKDAERDVCRAADECAVVLSTHLSPKVCLRLFCPLIRSAADDASTLAPALKMTTKVLEQLRGDDDDDLKNFLLQTSPDLIDNVIRCYDHRESCIRKASVLCLVAINYCIGEKNLEPYLAKLSSNKIKLFHMYIKKTQPL